MRRIRLLLLVAVLGGCTVGTTPASTTTLPATTTTAPPADGASASVMFRTCMTAAGFELEEIPVDPNGRPKLAALVGNTTVEYRAALTACAPLLGDFLAIEDGPGLAAMVRDQLTRFAQCMRASGVETFPDPELEFDGTSPPFPSIPATDPEFAVALEACASALTAARSES